MVKEQGAKDVGVGSVKLVGGVEGDEVKHTIAKLEEHRESMRAKGRDVVDGPVFVNRRGTWLRPKETGNRLRELLTAAGLPRIRLYDLRHTSATLLLAADVNLKVVSQRLGHTDVAITLRHYAGFMPGMQERAVAAMDRVFSLPTHCPNDTGHDASKANTEVIVNK